SSHAALDPFGTRDEPFLFGLIMQGGQLGQVIGPPVFALMVSMGEGGKSASWLLGVSAAAGVGFSLGLAVLKKRRLPIGPRNRPIVI
ncbi:MAG TPA: hypothetical protein VEL68_17850, partial [Thermodesulfobacteriota bacterium]|nr:hypothetical protein [Thermodesulfobacteriota bacterium]